MSRDLVFSSSHLSVSFASNIQVCLSYWYKIKIYRKQKRKSEIEGSKPCHEYFKSFKTVIEFILLKWKNIDLSYFFRKKKLKIIKKNAFFILGLNYSLNTSKTFIFHFHVKSQSYSNTPPQEFFFGWYLDFKFSRNLEHVWCFFDVAKYCKEPYLVKPKTCKIFLMFLHIKTIGEQISKSFSYLQANFCCRLDNRRMNV